ncbi:DNA-binding SARP family transcriptional activator/tetratricopeptide (TPR) repeat protein [Actinoplanes lutulentus]|uniref:ATP-binding protein n=1 Tax=Actinoplanes lutulentus TaxID=1287878 RepID=UPI001821A1EC|nr:AAA family ATPase [Actinoplanes lutulentus]MBB2946588.1 DNA-binding SARP family transcriptional activator/tetratricopeptide (TPR) repeat protein [Actinoplanes lutulentus]
MLAPARSGSIYVQVLGPLRIWRDGVQVDAGPRQQAYLFALLLAHAGHVVSTSSLVDLIWGTDVPPSAVNLIQKHVGGLRRMLEPGVTSRGDGSYVLRRGAGYVFAGDGEVADVVAFRELVATARSARDGAALDAYAEALGLWAGPAAKGMQHAAAAIPAFAALDGEFLDAAAAAAELAVALDRPQEVLAALRLAATMDPLHEPVHAGLVTTLAAAGLQAEALATFDEVRLRLAGELDVEPGPLLRAAHQRVLRLTLWPREAAGSLPRPAASAAEMAGLVGMAGLMGRAGLVGRIEERAELWRSIDAVMGGGSGVVLVEGEPGAGKTRLIEEAAAEARRRGAQVFWGQCLEGDGTPSMWPWVQVIETILTGLPAAARQKWLGGELGSLVQARADAPAGAMMPENDTRFRLFERVAGLVAEVSAQRPCVLIFDDLHWADVASLEVLAHLVTRLPRGSLVIGALRTVAPLPSAELTRLLAVASRAPGQRRIRLGPLAPADVAELVRRETGQAPEQDVVLGIHTRTAGNAFFVRELARLFAETGVFTADGVARAGVPATVRDVVYDRLAGLDDDVCALLRIAALVGRDIDLRLLAGVAGIGVQSCLDRLEPVDALGLLEPVPGNPFAVRFAHDLIRESVAGLTPRPKTPELHLRVADALEAAGLGDDAVAERLAHHLRAAGPLADPARTATSLIRAGQRAAAKSAVQAAEQHLRSAARTARSAGLAELELSALALTAAVGMQSRYGAATLDVLERAEQLARDLGWEREATGFQFSRWLVHATLLELDHGGVVARQLLEQGQASSDPTVRTYGLRAWGLHNWHIGDIGESFRYLTRSHELLHTTRDEDPVRYDVELLMDGMLAETTALHGRVDEARAMFDAAEAQATDPYAITVWSSLSARTAAIAGDPHWALRAAEAGIAADPDFSFVFLGTYQRLARCWALALTGPDPAAAIAEAQEIIAANLLEPTRTCVSTWHALLSEMWLAAGQVEEAAAALDRAEYLLETHGQRYAEGLILLLRARLMQARGAPVAAVRAAAGRAYTLSLEREAHLFARRVERFMAGLPG